MKKMFFPLIIIFSMFQFISCGISNHRIYGNWELAEVYDGYQYSGDTQLYGNQYLKFTENNLQTHGTGNTDGWEITDKHFYIIDDYTFYEEGWGIVNYTFRNDLLVLSYPDQSVVYYFKPYSGSL